MWVMYSSVPPILGRYAVPTAKNVLKQLHGWTEMLITASIITQEQFVAEVFVSLNYIAKWTEDTR